jgi:tetratricopeptide (TPR) repeat protein
LPHVETILGAGDGKAEEAIADGAVSALIGLMKKRLSLEERRIFATPHRQLAEALGHGLQAISVQKPLVLLLDTYEIVDRLECDRVLRMVIKAAGRRVVWAIAGRANLADSYRLSQDYFRGYRDEFSENLYVYPMSEFSREQVSEYFAHPEINVPLSDEAAESVKQFSLGIPFVVQQIAAMRQQGIEMATILSAPSVDRDDESPREAVVRATSDRFLRYCLDEQDKKAVYAMAMMRRPDNELLKAMLGVTDLEPEMRSLKARHSFVLLEGKGIRLHDKLESFLQDYLRCGLAGQSRMVRELSDRAVAYLELRLREWTQEFTDTADYFESDRIADGLLDLVQLKFWQDVEVGWRYAVPLFVESWQYDRDWQKQLLGVIEAFQVRFDGDSKKRLKIFTEDLGYYSFDPDSRKELLDELEKLAKRGWLDGDHQYERMLILSLQHGRLLYELSNYSETLQAYIELESQLSQTMLRLQKDLGQEFESVGVQLTQIAYRENSQIFSPEALTAFQYAVSLNPDCSIAWGNLGASKSNEKEIAISYLQKALNLSQRKNTLEKTAWSATIDSIKGNYESMIKLMRMAIVHNPKDAILHNGLGNVYQAQGNYELAITSYQQAINLDPKDAHPHNGLGNVYQAQGEYELAITSYQQAINCDPKNADYHLNLGIVYRQNSKYELAFKCYQKAIELNPKDSAIYNSLGILYEEQGKYELAIASYQQAINLDPKFAYPHNGLGNVYEAQGKYELAIASYQQAIDLDPKDIDYHRSLGIVYRKKAQYELALEYFQKAIELNPKNFDTHNSLGILYQDQGEYELAIASYQQAINLDPKNSYPKFNLGIVTGLQGNQEEAISLWKQGLELLTGNSQYDRLFRALHEVGVGEIERGTNNLREILETEKPPLGDLSDVLKDAELMARFPTKLEGIDSVVEMLRQAIEKVQ